jgi:hypothetical protein
MTQKFDKEFSLSFFFYLGSLGAALIHVGACCSNVDAQLVAWLEHPAETLPKALKPSAAKFPSG